MIKKYFLYIMLIFIFIFLFNSHSYALKRDTHESINVYIARKTFAELDNFSLDSYLKSQLGFEKGIEESVNNREIWDWLGQGGKKEDEPIRFLNHFHNPLTNEGLSKVLGLPCFLCESALHWAQFDEGTQHGWWRPGNYSWHDVRSYFYNALTETNPVVRETYLMETFRGLGQVMHLVQDMSVPEHARDDDHYLQAYEAWVKDKNNVKIYPELGRIYIDDMLVSPIFFDSSSIGDTNPLAEMPIANFFDTNQYTDSNPDPTITLQSRIGLSEYTNANFLSSDTMFTSAFPFPNAEHSEIHFNEDNYRLYLRNNGPGEKVEYLSHVGPLYFFRKRYFPEEGLYLPVGLDNTCYREYASYLIPRAVGYSAGLMKYFFRETIELSIPDDGFYAFMEDSEGNALTEWGRENGFTGIKINAINTTENDEEMPEGTIELIVKYRLSADSPFKKYAIEDYPVTTEEFFYIVASEKNGFHQSLKNILLNSVLTCMRTLYRYGRQMFICR